MTTIKRNDKLAGQLTRVAYVLTVVILLVVVFMRYIKIDTGIDFSFLPPLHASLNAITAILMIAALIIKQLNILRHRQLMTTAMVTSALFLISYVVYHVTTEETRFGGEGAVRYVYFFLLITHVVLAAVTLPFILFTFIRGYTGQVDRHKRMARWVFPLWLYVAITGPICYLMLMPYY